MLSDAALPQNPPSDREALPEEIIKPLEIYNGHVGQDSEAPSIIRLSYYSTEDEDFEVGYLINYSINVPLDNVSQGVALALAYAEDDSYISRSHRRY